MQKLENIQKDLTGILCPYCILDVLRVVEKMGKGTANSFIVDDPLAIKAIPEELEDEDDLKVEIERLKKSWKILITRN